MSEDATRKKQKESLSRKRAAYREFFNSEAGKEVLRDLWDFCFAMKPTAVISDPHATFFNEGKRRVWLRIFSFVYRVPLQDDLPFDDSMDPEPPDPYDLWRNHES